MNLFNSRMQRFYKNFESIHRLSLSLGFNQDKLECQYCFKNDQFISHGIIYKERADGTLEKVGKRLFCSNRYNHQGCGRTFQLYVMAELPYFRYGAAQLWIFISSLLLSFSITEAYARAIQSFDSTLASEPRHAWRWLDKLMRRLSDYRTALKIRPASPRSFETRSVQLQHLLPTLTHLTLGKLCPCSRFQLEQQQAFI